MAVHEFEDADDLVGLVSRVIAKNKLTRFAHLQTNMIQLRRRKSDRPATWYARISLVPKRFRNMFPDQIQYILEVDMANFDCQEDLKQEAIIFHELSHTYYDAEKDKYKLLKHPIQEFPEVIAEYGPVLNRQIFDAVNSYNSKNGVSVVSSNEDEISSVIESDEDSGT